MTRHLFAVCFIICATFGAVNAFDPPPDSRPLRKFEFSEPHMGTTCKIVLFAPDETVAKKAAKAAFERVAELNRAMSDYDPDSELMRLCKKAGGPPVKVGDDLLSILKTSNEIADATGGAFDVSISPVVRLWRRARRTRELPPADALKKAMALVDFRKIVIRANDKTVQLLIDGMMLDLGGIAKGYAAEAAIAVLRRHGVTRALVALGGDIAVSEPPPDERGWKIAVEKLAVDQPDTYVSLANASISTAGDANQFVVIGGKRYSHIVDPKTGLGLTARRSVTVVSSSGALADGFDTALCVLGKEKAMKLVEARADIACLFAEINDADKVEVVHSSRFVKHLVNGGTAP